jgi:sulfur carrier protein
MTRAIVNGEARDLPPGTTVVGVVESLTDRSRGIAVAVNGAVVPRGVWTSTTIRDGDAVEVLTAVQGG